MRPLSDQLTIIPFDTKYAKDFARLNVEWLEKYFVVEPLDQQLLEKCEETIVQKGGYIFFAKVEEEIAGTFSLIPVESNIYELGKMAVSPKFQGHKIGQQLLQHGIDFAKNEGWKKVILYSNTLLENAIYIYKKIGFVEIPIEKKPLYKRSNIKMELVL
ncbi:GNAT family N-acetyltransferase [Aquimarina spongiae]|uniref:Acetyltransferase (GNAT) domain-containing protein n=1 Tax=Aquimarina spongiae TaxID=570521 RepID=A0A1M6EDI2_9FLAO|nr:GNAT family N-acetyltransferase [Aquimarina spongiae]SHI83380.1 Acetyltransferase (GNAT) domain-containing protein [Aquimarina spongiae]